MKNLNKKQLVQSILNSLWPSEFPGEELKIEASALFFMRDGWLIYFGKEEAKEFQAALNQLLNYETLSNKYSTSAIRGGFESLVVKLLTLHDNRPSEEIIKREVNDWLESLETEVEHQFTYFTLIENLKVENEQTIGSVKIEPVSEKAIENIKSVIFAILDKNINNTPEQREAIKQSLNMDNLFVLEKNKSSSLASIAVSTKDENKGLQIAIERFQEAIDLLRFLGAFSYQPNLKRPIALKGEMSLQERVFIMLSDIDSWKIYFQHHSYPFKLDNNQLTTYKELGLAYLSSILEKNPEQRYEIENRLINAIHWVSEAMQEISDTARFLKLCICLESLLCGRDEEAFGTTIGERLAFLLSSIKEERQVIFRKTKKIYFVRSKIAHEGRPEKIDDLIDLMPYALAYAIHAIIKVSGVISESGWQKFDELKQHFEEMKFS